MTFIIQKEVRITLFIPKGNFICLAAHLLVAGELKSLMSAGTKDFLSPSCSEELPSTAGVNLQSVVVEPCFKIQPLKQGHGELKTRVNL